MQEIFFVHDQQESPVARKHYLEMSGYTVTTFTNGDDCLAVLEKRTPALVLMDVLIEGPNGFEICRTLRNRFTAEELPILLSSAVYDARLYRDEALEAGAQGYLVLPMEPNDLLRIVNEVVTSYAEAESVH